MPTLLRRGALGRVNAHRLFAYNAELKKDATRTRGYWEENKDAHPINRWVYRRWQRQRDTSTMFARTVAQLPRDQQFKLRNNKTQSWLTGTVVALLVGYVIMCYLRFAMWGITPVDGSAALARVMQSFPRAI